MFSALNFGWLLSGRLHLPSMLLPLLAFSVTFSSKPAYPDIVLHQIISSAFIGCSMVVFYGACRHKILAVGILTAVVVLRILRFGYDDENGVLEAIYLVPYSILLLGVGAKMLRDYPLLMLRQMVWICGISVLLCLLQIMGVQWAQSLTNFYSYGGGSAESYLFVRWSDLPPPSTIQMRPVGFAHANNVVSQYLLFFYGFTILWFAGNRQRFRPPLMWLFIVSFACALTGAKVVIAGIFLINIAALVFVAKKIQVARIFLATCFGYFCYWLLFPGLFAYNFNIDLFVFNSMIRLVDLMVYGGLPYLVDLLFFLSKYQTGEFSAGRSVVSTLESLDGAVITGIGSIIGYFPIIIITGLLLAPFWITRLRKLARGPYVDVQKLPIIMLVALVASTAGGPFIFTSCFWFFFSFGLYPLSLVLLRGCQSVWSERPHRASLSPSPA